MTESRSLQLVENVLKTPGSGGADLAFLRPNDHRSTHNPIAMSRLNLCLKNSRNSGLVRPPANFAQRQNHPSPISKNPRQAGSHVADLRFVRHQLPFPTN